MSSDEKNQLRECKSRPAIKQNSNIKTHNEAYGLLFSIADELSELMQMQLDLSLQHFASDMPGQFKSGLTLLSKREKKQLH